MLEQALRLMEEYDMTPKGGLVLCAVSGGIDSMCLLHFLHELSKQREFTVAAAHFNHRLRGGESDRDATFVAGWCRGEGIPCVVEAGDVAEEARRTGMGLEAAGRALRYAFLERTADALGAERIATAHHADDNAETLLLHLVRGAGLRGLTGIPPRRDRIVRPFLSIPRTELEEYLAEYGIPYVEDSSNADVAFARNRLRHEVIPVLRELNPRLTESMAATIRTLRADNDFLNAQAAVRASNALLAEDDLVIETEHIARVPAALAPRVVRSLLEMLGDGTVQAEASHLNAVVELCRSSDPSAILHLPGGILVQRVYTEVLFTTEADPLPTFAPVPLSPEGETVIPGAPWRVSCRGVEKAGSFSKISDTFYLKCDMIGDALLLRPRQRGDSISLPGRSGKTLKKLFIEAKVPRRIRERIPVLTDGREVLAVAGFGPDRRHLAAEGEPALEVTFISTDK